MSDSPSTEKVTTGVQRFANVYWKGSGSHHVVEDPEGEYVKHEDYEALRLAALELLSFGHPEYDADSATQVEAWHRLNALSENGT